MREGDRRDRDFGERRGGFRSGGFERRSFAPVKVGDELEVTIEGVGAKGDGVAKKDGFVLFVPNTKEGDTVKIRVTRVLRKQGFAEVIDGTSGSSTESQESSEQTEEAYGQSSEESSQESTQESSEEDASQDVENFGEEQEEQQ